MFSEFRDLMEKWDRASRLMLENDLCLFFRKDGRLYGAGESSRITFARMKNPESKEDKEWRREATFSAYDLEKGADATSVFSAADLPDIEIVDHDEAQKELKKKGKGIPVVPDEDDPKGKSIGEE
jgi:hypothetical protein